MNRLHRNATTLHESRLQRCVRCSYSAHRPRRRPADCVTSGGSSLLVSWAAAAPFIWSLVLYFRFCIVSRPLASRGAPERHVYCCWLRARYGLFLTRNQVYYTRTPSGGTLGACATRQGGVGGGRASSPERLAARSRGVKRVALRHSRAGGMAVERGRL